MWLKLSIYSLFLASIAGQSPVVEISQGTVVGSLASDGSYMEFFGIPYADSTSGNHRFKAPNPPPLFQDTFVADRKNVKCVRALGVGYEGTEDCLVADIFTPTLDSSSQLPVMVWIKGREFDQVYQHELSFKNFVEKEVIVVSLNFRESVLGFLCLGTETAPGNAGLKDIIAGLRWVQENIEHFGGNPNDVTLFGHGSGAAAVDLITMSPMANGLVHRAIAQSGNALAPWAVTRDNLNYAIQIAEALGHVVTNIEELSEVFTRTSVAALMAVINELDLTDNSLAFAPCLEKDNLEGVEPFIVKSPYQTIVDREFLQIPIIFGYVDKEGTIRSEEALEHNWLERMETSFADFLQPDLEFENEEQELQVAEQIKSFYFRDNEIDMNHIDDYFSYHGDTMMLVSALREVRMRVTSSTQPVYLYQFSYKGSLGEPFAGPLPVDSAAHSEELAYMFHDITDAEVPQRDLTIGDILIERWTNFAKTGSPASETSQIIWQPFSNIIAFYLRILNNEEINEQDDATLEILLQNPHPDTVTFWDQIYNEHFLDANTNFNLTVRDENDDDESIPDSEDNDSGTTEEPEVDDVIPEEDNEVPEEDNEVPEDDIEEDVIVEEDNTEDDATDSASTAFGYTFSIVILFSMLNKFHSYQILS